MAQRSLNPFGFLDAAGEIGASALRHPLRTTRALADHGGEVWALGAAVANRAAGGDAAGPVDVPAKSRQFNDPAWNDNPFFYGLRQYHGLVRRLGDRIIDESDADDATRRKAALLWRWVVEGAAPTNFLATNPAALKRAFETGGRSLVMGAQNFLYDLATNGGMPRQVDTRNLRVGRELAATPGWVVHRNELMELLMFTPQTEEVHEIPLLMSPPWINKYYVMDLAPGRSFIEWAVQHGHVTFAISYRNPDASLADVSLDDYLRLGPLTAIEVMQELTGSDQVNLAALCLGGTLASATLAYLAANGEPDRVRSATLTNTLVDFCEPGELGNFLDEASVEHLEEMMSDRGFLDGSEMASTFNLLRATDLIWSYVGPNWLMGEDPPAFDILAWNGDSTRMPAAMHSFYLRRLYLANDLAEGRLSLLDTALDLAKVENDVFLLGAEEDHIAPWTSVYAGSQRFGKPPHFVLTNSGHIAGIVNPPSPRSQHRVGDATVPTATEWRDQATHRPGSWWEHWAEWVADRAGSMVAPPAEPESLGPAPGTHVFERSD